MILHQQLHQVLSAVVNGIKQRMTTILQMINSVVMTTATIIITAPLTSSKMSGSTPFLRKKENQSISAIVMI